MAETHDWRPYPQIVPPLNTLVEVWTRHNDVLRLGELCQLDYGVPSTGRKGLVWIRDDTFRLYVGTDAEGHDAVVTHWRPVRPSPVVDT